MKKSRKKNSPNIYVVTNKEKHDFAGIHMDLLIRLDDYVWHILI